MIKSIHRARALRAIAAAAGLVALVNALAGCRKGKPPPPAEMAIYAVDDGVKIGRDGEIFSNANLADYHRSNPVWDGKTVRMAGARGEVVAFQVMIRAGAALPLANVDVSAFELRSDTGAIPPSAVELFRQWYIDVTLPSTSPAGSTGLGQYPDALVPRDLPEHGLPVDIPGGKTQGVWIDVTIPRDTQPGEYRGVLTVTAGAEKAPLASMDVALTVYDFAIPKERHLRWRVGYADFGAYLNERENIGYNRHVGKESQAFRDREAQLYRLLWAHRLIPTTHYSPPRPAHTGTGADLVIDFDSYDRRFGAYLDGSAFPDNEPLPMASLPVNPQSGGGGWPTSTHGSPAEVDTAALEAAVRQTVQHWRDKGWPLKNAFIYLADEPPPERDATVLHACAAIRRVSPEVPVSVALYTRMGTKAEETVRAYQGCVTMWDIAGDYMNLPALAGRQAAGETIGFYQGSEPYQGSEALDTDGLALTTWPWIAWRYGLDHLFLYNTTEWNYERLNDVKKPWSNRPRDIWQNPLNQSWQTNSQGVLIYPGDRVGFPGVLPSIRLKQARRGMQDYEYLWLAASAGQRERADAVARQIIPKALHEAGPGFADAVKRKRGAWPRDPHAWAQARRDLAAAILAK